MISPLHVLRTHAPTASAAARSYVVAISCMATATFASSQVADGAFKIDGRVGPLLEKYCISCHEEGAEKGNVRLDHLSDLPKQARLDLMNQMLEQVYLKQMPPADKKSQPTDEERGRLAGWLWQELRSHNAAKLDEKLRYPAYGNFVDHATLFSGKISEKPFTPSRRWLVSPSIFTERVADVFKLEGKEREVARKGFHGVTNPFVLPEHPGVRDYDIGSLDGGHLLVMLTNAQWVAGKQIQAARIKSGDFKPEENSNARDRWYPKVTPAAFEEVIRHKGPPADDQLIAAIQTQFDCVLQRPASNSELQKYLPLTRTAIDLGGNAEGLRQMLISVLLESEFLYRQEFGAGTADAHGRHMLSPREGSYAISWALGDRGPDAKLRAAAANGKLNTKEDYRREVTRLLEDKNYYRGEIDRTLDGKNMKGHVTGHPRLIRFFREFFGYPNSTKVFKDPERGAGIYQNPDRGTAGTAGFLINEADRVVDHILAKDRDVFTELLTTDEYFVYHNRDNEAGRKIIEGWRSVWEALKDTNWQSEPEKVIVDHSALLSGGNKSGIQIQIGPKQKREFLFHMYFFSDHFGKGITPFTTISTAHGYTFNHSPIYNLPPTPLRGRYGNVENPNFKGLDDSKFWDYPVQQPFKIAHRKGILTHPAWLIAFSQNAATDPVRRGRWIREKLLAGHVPDVPITVDAQIPEDPHRSLRQRLETVTTKQECWKCHQHMNPLGLAFEHYDDLGRFRLVEALEHPDNILTKGNGKDTANTFKTLPVNSLGHLDGTGDTALDGEVKDAMEMIERLAKSTRARQSIIRHAFRFFMGRNEMLSDSATLMDADSVYVNSGGSFNAVITSLLTSDSFLYRKPNIP